MSEVNAVQKADIPEINAQAAIVVTQHEGKILLEKNAKLKMYPAFATKILASIIALEKCNPSEIVTISEATVSEMLKWKGSAAINLHIGEKISILDLIYSMMLVSANDSMFAIAEHISGDKDKFTQLMQEKARAVGALETTLTDENGCFTAEQLSNAYDMAIICRYCMTNKMFRQIAATDKYTIPATNKNDERPMQNTNLLINNQSRRYRYETAIGIKSGYSHRSKACLACAALPPEGKFGEEVLTIILGAENTKQMKYVFNDAITLLDYTYDNFEALSGKSPEKKAEKDENSIFSVTELYDAIGAKQRNVAEAPITTFAYGKQKIMPGCAYFAADEASARKAIENGAGIIIAEEVYHGIPCIAVHSLSKAKVMVAALLKAKLGLWSIAIMDSPDKVNPYGMVTQILSDKIKIVKSNAMDNNYESILKSMLSATKKTSAAVMNVSCSPEGNVQKTTDIANFDIAIISSAVVSKNTRELSKPQLIEEKLKICEGMSEAGAVIINIDDKNLASIFSIPQDIITVGVDNRMADYVADNIEFAQNKISFTIVNGPIKYPIQLYSDDKHAIYQALEAFALGMLMGLPAKQIIASIEKYRKSDGLNKVKNERGVYVISDFENQGKESMSAAIKELCSCFLTESARRIAVLGDLGTGDEDYEKDLYRKVGTLINKCSVDIAVCVGSNAAEVAKTADLKNKSIILLESKEAVTEYLRLNIRDNDAVLFKASSDTGLDDVMTEVT